MASVDKKKALIIHHSGLMGGAGRSLIDLIRGLEAEFQIEVYVPSSPPNLLEFLRSENMAVHEVGFRMAKIPLYSGGENRLHPRTWYYVAAILFQARYWRRLMSTEQPDVVILNSGVLSWMSLVIGDRLSVLMVRETLAGSPRSLTNRAIRRLRNRFSVVAYLSQYDLTRDALRRPETLIVRDASSGLSNIQSKNETGSLRAKLRIGPDQMFVLFLGGSNRLKGLDLLIDALRLLPRGQYRLIVGGSPPIETTWWGRVRSGSRRFDTKVLRDVKQAGCADEVEFIGIREDVESLYRACDVVVFPMRQAHQARPAFEAGMFGKPIIITDFENIRECVADGENGLTFENGNAEGLASCLMQLSEDPDKASQLGGRNAVHAAEMHTHSAVYGMFVDKLKTCLAGDARPEGRR